MRGSRNCILFGRRLVILVMLLTKCLILMLQVWTIALKESTVEEHFKALLDRMINAEQGLIVSFVAESETVDFRT